MQSLSASEAWPCADDPVAQKDKLVAGGRLPRLLVATVGAITTGPLAEKLLKEGSADVVFVGRQFLRNPGMVWAWADELAQEGEEVQIALASQIGWGFKGRGKRASDGHEDHTSKPNECKRLGSCKV